MWRNEQHNCYSSSITFFFLFLLLIVSVQGRQLLQMLQQMLNDIILRTMMSKMCCSKTPLFTSNVEVGEKIFGGAMMIFNLHAQWWGVILVVFLRHHIFLPLLGFLMYPGGDALSNHPKQDKLNANWKKLDPNCKKNTLPQDYKVCENVMKFSRPSPLSPPISRIWWTFPSKTGNFWQRLFLFLRFEFYKLQRFTNSQKPAKFILPYIGWYLEC